MFSKSNTLKLALFATGLSGIVAEYILSTLATYFLGNSVLQWTLILSTMLFSMGLGSRISKYMENGLLEKFVIIEFALSILVGYCAIVAYGVSAYASFDVSHLTHAIRYDAVVIYAMAIAIGVLIGMEIPLVTRLNEEFESLRVNISNVMEKDYYGSLAGGLFFAFVGLPILGLTYTPFILGAVNFLVAVAMYLRLYGHLRQESRRTIVAFSVVTGLFLLGGAIFAERFIAFGEQKRYRDNIVFQAQTQYQKLVVTQWKNDYWFYINDNQQLSTFDEWLYHEPLVLPAMSLHPYPAKVLVLGGGDGCAVREVLKYPSVEEVVLVDLDPKVTELAATHPVFQEMNGRSLADPRVQVVNDDAFTWLASTQTYFDVVIIDFPDPKTIELGRLYSLEFYRLCYRQMRPEGVIVTQSGSPYYATRAFMSIGKTMAAAGFEVVPLHNQVMTMGEWGWNLGVKQGDAAQVKARLRQIDFAGIPTRWLNQEAMQMVTSFGKPLVPLDSTTVEVNTIHNPVLPDYYRAGNWDLF